MGLSEELAYNHILKSLLAGEYRAGERLREEDLAEVVGVSRTPIREALRRLNGDGFITFRPNSGAQVRQWSKSEVDEVLLIRADLEGRAAGLAASRADDDGLYRLSQLAESMSKELGSQAADRVAIGAMNTEFHDQILAMAGSSHLSMFVSRVRSLAMMHMTFRTYTSDQLRRSVDHHSELVTAFEHRDPLWAEALMRTHVLAARAAMLQELANAEEKSRRIDMEMGR